MTNDNLPISELDFAKSKQQLKNFLASQTRFKDYNFEGSNMSTLLDVLSYNSFLQNYYANMMFSEMFLDSASLDTSVYSHAKELNYLPRSRKSAIANIRVYFYDVPPDVPYVVIPARTRFNGMKGSRNVSFFNEKSVVVYPINGVFFAELQILEGRYVTETYIVSESPKSDEYVITSKDVDLGSIAVNVKAHLNSTSVTDFKLAADLFGLVESDTIFMVEPHYNGNYRVVFGMDVWGQQPKTNNVVQLTYRVASGEEANGVTSFAAESRISDYVAYVETLNISSGGAEKETIESIKTNAPRALQTQERAVTTRDYKTLLTQNFPEIEAVSVYGGEKETPPQFGKVIVVVDTVGGYGSTDFQKQRYAEFLDERNPIAITTVVKDAQFLFVQPNVTVWWNSKLSDSVEDEIRSKALGVVKAYSKSDLEDFECVARSSKITKLIDASDKAIVSSSVHFKAIFALTPNNQSIIDTRLVLNQKIFNESIFNPSKYTASIKSTSLTQNGINCFLMDDGQGIINLYSTSNDGVFGLVKGNCGTVDYTKGIININSLEVQSFVGNAIELMVRIKDEDLKAPMERIMAIRDKDITLVLNVEK